MTNKIQETSSVRSYNIIDDADWEELDAETKQAMRSRRLLVWHKNRPSWRADVIYYYTEWCLENASGLVRLTKPQGFSDCILMWFACEADAVALKLHADGRVVA
jgi:hypothetical protein